MHLNIKMHVHVCVYIYISGKFKPNFAPRVQTFEHYYTQLNFNLNKASC